MVYYQDGKESDVIGVVEGTLNSKHVQPAKKSHTVLATVSSPRSPLVMVSIHLKPIRSNQGLESASS
jgi:hypothetical protein